MALDQDLTLGWAIRSNDNSYQKHNDKGELATRIPSTGELAKDLFASGLVSSASVLLLMSSTLAF